MYDGFINPSMEYTNRPLPALPTEPNPSPQLLQGVQHFYNNAPLPFLPENLDPDLPEPPKVCPGIRNSSETNPADTIGTRGNFENDRHLQGSDDTLNTDTNQFETPEENLLQVLPYYNTIIPEFGRSVSTHSSSMGNGKVFNIIRPNSPPHDYSNKDIEHQLRPASSHTLYDDDEKNLRFENEAEVGELMEGALEFTTKPNTENRTTDYENGRRDFSNNEQHNIIDGDCEQKESLPDYLNAEIEKNHLSKTLTEYYSRDYGHMVKFENQNDMDQLEENELHGNVSETKDVGDGERTMGGRYVNGNLLSKQNTAQATRKSAQRYPGRNPDESLKATNQSGVFYVVHL